MKKTNYHRVYITDYIKNPNIEKKILGNNLSNEKNKYNSEILLVWHKSCDQSYLKKFKNLKLIVRYGIGVDNIDLEYCKKNKIKVANTPDYGVDEVSDTALAMILYFARSIGFYDNQIKKKFGNWQLDVNKNITRSNETNVGIIGYGSIGRRLSIKLYHLGFNCFYYDPYIKKISKYSKKISNLKVFLKKCHLVSIHCTLNETNKNLVNSRFLNLMKKNGTLINTARGKIFSNLDIVLKHLKKNNSFSFGLDVLPKEPPLESDRLIKLWKKNIFNGRLLINPHTAYYSTRSIVSMREKASKNVLNFIQKNYLKNRIK